MGELCETLMVEPFVLTDDQLVVRAQLDCSVEIRGIYFAPDFMPNVVSVRCFQTLLVNETVGAWALQYLQGAWLPGADLRISLVETILIHPGEGSLPVVRFRYLPPLPPRQLHG